MRQAQFVVRWLAGLGLLGWLGACEVFDGTVAPLLTGEPLANADTTPRPPGSDEVSEEGLTGAALVGQRPPLVLIRFERPEVGFERPLRSAVEGALARRPEAVFDVVAIEPKDAGAGRAVLSDPSLRHDLARVYESLVAAGVPAERISLSATTLPGAAVREVHLYDR